MNGYGEFIWKEGKKYFGFYKKDKKNGFGIFFWPNDKFFCGFWKNGKQNGFGKFIKGNVVKFGFWKDGKKEFYFDDQKDFEDKMEEREQKYLKILKYELWQIKNFMNIE